MKIDKIKKELERYGLFVCKGTYYRVLPILDGGEAFYEDDLEKLLERTKNPLFGTK